MNKRIKSLLLCLAMAFTLVATAAPALADSVETTSVTDGATPSVTVGNENNSVEITPIDPTQSITPNTTPSIKIDIPFTKTVVKGGAVEPGKQSFELEILKFVDGNGEPSYPGVGYTATVSTNGADDYEGELVITGPKSQVEFATEELYVREKNTGADKWTYSDTVWCVRFEDGENGPSFYPTTLIDNGYERDYEADAAEKMTFENTYTENKPAPTATPAPTSPKTGDESSLALWLTLLLGGTAAAALVIGMRKKTDR